MSVKPNCESFTKFFSGCSFDVLLPAAQASQKDVTLPSSSTDEKSGNGMGSHLVPPSIYKFSIVGLPSC
jgi:hypothetical protein